ncbi:hypothetical protein [Bradyrhizobium sp. USDA 329]|uniref:hypothetical protein n=1 Tax=unclassified Bradyrhizobium TaxID=2631580 RepID=UPI0035196D2D
MLSIVSKERSSALVTPGPSCGSAARSARHNLARCAGAGTATGKVDDLARQHRERLLAMLGVRKARAEVAAYADCTESQMMAMFGWTDPKMPAPLHRSGESREARPQRHEKGRRIRSEPVTR